MRNSEGRAGEHHPLPCFRMEKADAARPEGDPARLAEAVFPVAEEGVAARRKLHADLMRPPGLERNADERLVVYTGENAIGEPRLLRAGRPGLGHAGQAVAAVAEQKVLHPPFCGKCPVDDGEIFLLKAVFADLS